MAVSYKKLWKLLIDKDMKKKDLCAKAGISPASVTKMGRNGHVTTEILLKICTALDCRIEDVLEIVLPKYKTVIFVNGCFWHKHDCSRFVWPSSNQEYWIPKIQHNVERDKKNIEALNILGWAVITVWECELKKKVREKRLEQLCAEIKGECVNGTD